jgi:hypothetical protein
MKFEPVKLTTDDDAEVPPAWVAAATPYTFVVTMYMPGRYAASANDARNKMINRTPLGSGFTTLAAAQEACDQFARRHRQ